MELLAGLLVREVADLQVGAICGEPAAKRRGDGRTEVAAHVRRTEDHDLRRAFLHQLDERVAIRLVAEDLERRIVNEMHDVRPAGEKLLCERLDARTHQHGANLDAQLVRQLPCLAEKLERNSRELAVFLLGENPDFTRLCAHRSTP